MRGTCKLLVGITAWAAFAAFSTGAHAALGADSDGDGLPDALEAVYGRSASIRDNDVFGSSELFAMQQYRDFLRREGDRGGIDYWTGQVRTGAITRESTIASFLAAPEFEGRIAPVARLYFAYFRRIPDVGGLLFWSDQSAAGVALADISQAFASSSEFQQTYGALTNADYVTQVYRNVLGRDPDAGGFAFWKGQLDAGAQSRGSMMLAFSESPEYRGLIGPQVQVTMLYVGMLQRAPDTGGFNFWTAQIASGTSSLQLIASFFQSAEYKARFLGPDADTKTAAYNAFAARLLNTTSFGPTPALVAHVRDLGPVGWVEEQLAAAPNPYPVYPFYPATKPANCTFTTSGTTPESLCERDNYSLYLLQNAFFTKALNGPDQLRQRVAFALGQVFVVSGTEVSMAYPMRNFHQKMLDGAFGNFEDLMYAVTVDPVMGRYLDMANNDKANASGTVQPNENYARELMQLFTLGVSKLNPDGSLKLDAQNEPIPTYDQSTVIGFARVFTGWTWPTLAGATPRWTNPTSYHDVMVPIQSHHDVATKTLLSVTLPANQAADTDLRAALHDIFLHENVGPFIGRQLIQQLVTSNPSPAYVARVSAAFNNNGAGVRGDLRAVVRAIVLDSEALGAHAPDYGKLKEPALFVVSLLRAMGGTSDGLYLRQQASNMGQNLFTSPSVFNYYPADYIIPGTDLDGPPFGLYNATTIFTRANYAYSMTFGGGANPDPNSPLVGAIGTHIDLAPFQALASDVPRLVDTIGDRLLPGQMTPEMRNAVITAVSAVSATSTLDRVRTAVYLIALSPRFQLER